MDFVPCVECRGMVGLKSDNRYSPDQGANIYHAQCYIKRLDKALREGYEMVHRRVFAWGGYPPPMDEPDERRRGARRDEAFDIEHQLRRLAADARGSR